MVYTIEVSECITSRFEIDARERNKPRCNISSSALLSRGLCPLLVGDVGMINSVL